MDRLLDIKRTGGFPVDAEVVELLYNQRRYIETILGSLRLTEGSVVFLEENENEGISGTKYLTDSWIYVVPFTDILFGGTGSNAGKIKGSIYKLKGDGSIKIADLLAGTASKRGLQINETKYSTVDEYNNTYPDYMSKVEMQLVAAAEDRNYRFYRLTDLLEEGSRNNKISLSSVKLYREDSGSTVEFASVHNLHESFVQYNSKKATLQLGMKFKGLPSGAVFSFVESSMKEIVLTGLSQNVGQCLGMAVGECYPLLSIIKTTSKIYNVLAMLIRVSLQETKIVFSTSASVVNDDFFEFKGEFYF